MAIPTVPEKDFEQEVRNSQMPTLIYFYADQSAPCIEVEPEVEAPQKT